MCTVWRNDDLAFASCQDRSFHMHCMPVAHKSIGHCCLYQSFHKAHHFAHQTLSCCQGKGLQFTMWRRLDEKQGNETATTSAESATSAALLSGCWSPPSQTFKLHHQALAKVISSTHCRCQATQNKSQPGKEIIIKPTIFISCDIGGMFTRCIDTSTINSNPVLVKYWALASQLEGRLLQQLQCWWTIRMLRPWTGHQPTSLTCLLDNPCHSSSWSNRLFQGPDYGRTELALRTMPNGSLGFWGKKNMFTFSLYLTWSYLVIWLFGYQD